MAEALPVNRAGSIRDQRYLQILTRRGEDAGARAASNDETEQHGPEANSTSSHTSEDALSRRPFRGPISDFLDCRHTGFLKPRENLQQQLKVGILVFRQNAEYRVLHRR